MRENMTGEWFSVHSSSFSNILPLSVLPQSMLSAKYCTEISFFLLVCILHCFHLRHSAQGLSHHLYASEKCYFF